MKLYVAGPMTGHPDFNYPAFHAAAEALRGMGHAVICPAEAFGGAQDLAYTDYARSDLHYLLQVEGVVLLDGWGGSKGACTEVAVAAWLGLPFFYLQEGALGLFHPDNPAEVYAHGART